MEKSEIIAEFNAWLDEYIPYIHANGYSKSMAQKDIEFGRRLDAAGVTGQEIMDLTSGAIIRHGGSKKLMESIMRE